MTDLISVTETAEQTGLARKHIIDLCARGSIAGAVQIGHQWCVPRGWAEAHAAEDYSATHISLTDAARLAGISRQRLYVIVRQGGIRGFAQRLVSRSRWWVDKDDFARWLSGRQK